MWWLYALLSAGFAALTALLAKVGGRSADFHVATAVRTTVVLVLARTSLGVLVFFGTALAVWP
jgi:transporter family protein